MDSYDLTALDPGAFEHLVNLLATQVLGSGHTGFGPGSDGGRDGYFEGEAPYPSEADHWSGRWYIQSKFHKPHLSTDPQKWLIDQLQSELEQFSKPTTKRVWPDNWIIATNIDPSGTPMTGSFDQAETLISKARPQLAGKFHIWGGRKILDLLATYPEAAKIYGHFLTPGHVLAAMYNQIKDQNAEAETIIRDLVVKQFGEQQYTKLEQAGSDTDNRPGIQRLFIDLPFRANAYELNGMGMKFLVRASARNHRVDANRPDSRAWRYWNQHPARARVWFLKGGPGQGKSTIGQYFCQIQRAALLLQQEAPSVVPGVMSIAKDIQTRATEYGLWPTVPRIPISIELKEYAQWLSKKGADAPKGLLTYLAERIALSVEQEVLVGTLKRMLRSQSWLVIFDGLDEVPQDVKETVASEVINFVNNIVPETGADVFTLCTSRPQGYSGQFSELDGPTLDLLPLSPDQALLCAKPVIEIDRPEVEARNNFEILKSAMESNSVKELMTTPLQSHIMAVVVRDGGKPPERRWQLFNNFYQVIRKREANRNLPDSRVAKLLREDEALLKTVHNRLGFLLHAKAELSQGALTNLDRNEFRGLITEAVSQMIEANPQETVDVLMAATTDRLVLVNTPDDGHHVRFDIRPLQEFFAAEFLYEGVEAEQLRQRLEVIVGDSHWREVVHFLMSALVEHGRSTELSVAIDVLESLDNREEESALHLLQKRLGSGSLQVARLLQEGVLEHDKRLRQRFRKCLEPLAAFIESTSLSLMHLTQPDSTSWLISYLIQSMKDFNYSNNIGASLLLTYLLEDGDRRVPEVSELLLSSPAHYFSYLLTTRSAEMEVFDIEEEGMYEGLRLPDWFIETIFQAVISNQNWYVFDEDGLRGALDILQYSYKHKPETVQRFAMKIGMSEGELRLLGLLLEDEAVLSDGDETIEQYGFLRTQIWTHDWTTADCEFDSWPSTIWEEAAKAKGILQLVYQVLHFAQTQKYAEIQTLITAVDTFGAGNTSVALSPRVQAYLPLNCMMEMDDQINQLKALSENEFDILLHTKRIGSVETCRPWKRLTIDDILERFSWTPLIENLPQTAIELWAFRFMGRADHAGKQPTVDDSDAINALAMKMLLYPDSLLKFPNLWGEILQKATDHEAELRQRILEISSAPVARQWLWSEQATAFRLQLPEEAALIPHIIEMLRGMVSHFRHSDIENMLYRFRQTLAIYVADQSILRDIATNINVDRNTRRAAILMLITYPNRNEYLAGWQNLIIELYDASSSYWYLKTVATCFLMIMPEATSLDEEEQIKSVVNRLLDLTRDDFTGRGCLNPLIHHWREKPNQVVHRANVARLWLAGDA